MPGVEYMLVEDTVPDGYVKDSNPKTVKVEKQENGVFTTLQGSSLDRKEYPFNWNQGAILKVNNEPAEMYNRVLPPATDIIVTGQDGTEDSEHDTTGSDSGTTQGENSDGESAEDIESEKIELTDGKIYPENSSLVSFRTEVENKINHTELDVTKKWLDNTNKPTGESGYTISFVVKRWYMKNGTKTEEYVPLNTDSLVVEEGQNDITLTQSEGKSVITLTCTEGSWPVAHLQKLLLFAENNDQLTYTYEVEETAHTSNGKTVALEPVTYKFTEGKPDRIDIINKEKDNIHINVKKKWKNSQGGDVAGADAPEEFITFDVYRRTHVAHVHVWGDPEDYQEPTCTKTGSYTHTCLKCGASESVTVPAKGHVPGEWETVREFKDPTDGLRYVDQVQYCTVCHHELDKRTLRSACEGGAHQFEEHVDTPPGCTTTGTGHYVCSVCGEPQPDSAYVIPATGHNWDEGTLDHNPDCENGATRTYTCGICHETYQEAVPALGHDWIEHRTEPTCHTEGLITYTCRRDETHTKESVVLPKLDHQWDDGEVITPATATSKGTIRYTCLLCGDTRDEDIDKLRETYIANGNVDTGIVVEPFEWPYYEDNNEKLNHQNDDYKYDATGIIKYIDPVTHTTAYGVIYKSFDNPIKFSQIWDGPGTGSIQDKSLKLSGDVYTYKTNPRTETNPGEFHVYGIGKGDLYQVEDGTWYVKLKDGTDTDVTNTTDWYKLPEAGVIGTASSSGQSPSSLSRITLRTRRGLRSINQRYVALKVSAPVPDQTLSEIDSEKDDEPAGEISDKALSADQKEKIAAFLGIDQTAFMSREESDNYNGAGTDVIEYVETVTVRKTENNAAWSWTSGDYDYADKDGNVYTYFAIETSPDSGYETTYSFSGETNKLKDKETETITNQKKEPQKVTITIQKEDALTKDPLPGVRFILTQVDEDGHTVPDGIVKNGQTSGEPGQEGVLTFEDIIPGRYKLEEDGTPAGYIVSEGPYFLNVVSGDGNDSVDDILTLKYIQVDGHTYTIGNEPGVELPHTGGPGTRLIYLLGGMLTAFAVLVLGRRKLRG